MENGEWIICVTVLCVIATAPLWEIFRHPIALPGGLCYNKQDNISGGIRL